VTQKVHHQTERGARIALAKKQISQESYEAIRRGELSLAQARELGRDRGPQDTGQASGGHEEGTDRLPQPVSRISKDDRSRACMCACGTRTKGGRFVPGHDIRMVSYAKEYLRGERELTDEQMTYVRDSGKLERASTRLAEEERRRLEQVARKAERQAKAQMKDEK
jgi:hypothetical protein